jgi:DNA transformation protein
MTVSNAYVELLKDQLSDFAPIAVRRMFSGIGRFADGLMFAIAIDDVLYLKADEETRATFEAEGLSPFSYTRGARTVALSYWRAPERLLDDADEMREWAAQALSVAKRMSSRKPGKPKSKAKKRRKSS